MSEFAFEEQRAKEEGNLAVGYRSYQKKVNRTGIPTQLKERLEQSTGVSLDDVRVNYNSGLPARLDALAYTKGNRVEIGSGQERHLPHELGHVVQQKLGMVRANAMHPSGEAMNTDQSLERQADEIGAGKRVAIAQRMGNNVVQRCGDPPDGTGPYRKVGGHHVMAKAAFRGDVHYNLRTGYSISQKFMNGTNPYGVQLNHADMTRKQRELFNELARSGRPNTLQEHLRIARAALEAGGATPQMIEDLMKWAEEDLAQQGVTAPTRIPWN